MQLLDYAVEELGEVELVDSSDRPMEGDDGKPMVVVVYGPGSKQWQKAQGARQARLLKILRQEKDSNEQRRNDEIEFVVALTKSFSSNISLPGREGLEGRDLFRAVYSEPKIGFIVDQISAYVGSWGNFKKESEEV